MAVKESRKEAKDYQNQISLADFLTSFNKNMPASFPQVTETLLLKFKEEHTVLFKNTDTWSLDLHRKRLIDWLPKHV